MTKFSYFLGSEQWQPETLLKHAQLAKKAGFDMVTISEHFHPWVDDTQHQILHGQHLELLQKI